MLLKPGECTTIETENGDVVVCAPLCPVPMIGLRPQNPNELDRPGPWK